jgi:CMP-N,N'-diacetyllegionaminic acid synthase
MRRLAVICARGGSKGVPNKNIRMLGDIPLIAHTINQAAESGIFSAIAVSSDSQAILDVARDFGVQHLILRPSNLASDTAPKVPAIRHCCVSVERTSGLFDYVADLDCTVPYRLTSDITGAFDLIEGRNVSSLITGTAARKIPYFNMVELTSDGFVRISKSVQPPLIRRQDAPKCFDMNASIHIWQRSTLFSSDDRLHQDTILFEMPFERSIDIDTELEFELNEFLMRRDGLI